MEKKIYYFLIILAVVFPISVNANIVCNDGTISPSCVDCHKGCCSNHGGCSNAVATQKTTKKVTKISAKTTTTKISSTSSRVTTTKSTTTESTTTTTSTKTTTKNKTALITEEADEKENDNENEDIPVGLLAIPTAVGAGIAVVANKKRKQ